MAAMAMVPMTREESDGPEFDPEYGVGRRGPIPARIRAFPNEDILLWRKPESGRASCRERV